MAGKHGTLWCAIMDPLACWQTTASYYHIGVTPTMVMEVVMMLMAITITIQSIQLASIDENYRGKVISQFG